MSPWAWRRRRLPLRGVDLALSAAAFAVVGLTWFALLYRRLGMAPDISPQQSPFRLAMPTRASRS